MASPYSALTASPGPVSAFQAYVPTGVAPLAVTSFKASLILGGSALVEGNFRPFTVNAGDLVLMRPGARCGSISLSPVDLVVMQVHPMFLVDQVRWSRPPQQQARKLAYRSLVESIRQPASIHLSGERLANVSDLFEHLAHLSQQSATLGPMLTHATQLIWEIESMLTAAQQTARWRLSDLVDHPCLRPEVQQAIRLIHEHYASDVSIRELAHTVALSESALRRALLASTGFSPRDYLHRVRLTRFEELVAETSVPLAEAARMVGWTSASHARAAFVRSHGMSPREFRAEAREARRADWRHRSGVELDAPPKAD